MRQDLNRDRNPRCGKKPQRALRLTQKAFEIKERQSGTHDVDPTESYHQDLMELMELGREKKIDL